jgi:hypothetical protein
MSIVSYKKLMKYRSVKYKTRIRKFIKMSQQTKATIFRELLK